MNKILTIEQAIEVSQKLRADKKKIVLVGGCFDVLHIGHIRFLQHAKKEGNFLFIMLESDKKISLTKGDKRPVHAQEQRAEILASLTIVDAVILLPFFEEDNQYDKLVTSLHPAIIATTKGDASIDHKARQAKQIESEIIEVIDHIPTLSSSSILQTLIQDMTV